MSMTSWFTLTELRSGVLAVDFDEPPAGYPFSIETVLSFTDDEIIYEIRLARWRQVFHRRNPLMREVATSVITWLCMMRPQVLADPRLFRLSND